MTITGVSSTTMTVRRSPQNQPSAHPTLARVFTGVCGAGNFMNVDPPTGACVAASSPLPWINLQTGDVWLCHSILWTATNLKNVTYNSVAPGLPW